MSKTRKPLFAEENLRESETPAHKKRREQKQRLAQVTTLIPEEQWDEDEDKFETFQPIKRKRP